jgi:hypothetical protein
MLKFESAGHAGSKGGVMVGTNDAVMISLLPQLPLFIAYLVGLALAASQYLAT